MSQRTDGVVEQAAAETATGFKKEIRLGRPFTSPRGWKNKLAPEEIMSPERSPSSPSEFRLSGPLSENAVYLAILRKWGFITTSVYNRFHVRCIYRGGLFAELEVVARRATERGESSSAK